MDEIKKAAFVQKQPKTEEDLALINAQALRELKAEEVFVFRLAACDDQVDRDNERFTLSTLDRLAELFVGRPVLMDHQWSAREQTARIYAAGVEEHGGIHRLVLRAYMLRMPETESVVGAIEGGILREVSVGCAVKRALCSVCGADKARKACGHQPGQTYDGQMCHVDLDQAEDAYEVSFVAVPAQLRAGVIKQYGGEGTPRSDAALSLALARQSLEELRYGGNFT